MTVSSGVERCGDLHRALSFLIRHTCCVLQRESVPSLHGPRQFNLSENIAQHLHQGVGYRANSGACAQRGNRC